MSRPIRVAVAGALGKLGSVAHAAFSHSAQFDYAGGLARTAVPSERIVASLDELLAQSPDVLLDATTMPSSLHVSLAAARRGCRVVVGASGWSDADRAELEAVASEAGVGAMIVPNFSRGALLMMHFAREAAPVLGAVEIVEMHRIEKKDKPSGTALETARIIAGAGGGEPPIHSIRLPGLVAHQEVFFGGDGELLTIRHDSFSRESFAAGMLAAARAVMGVRGLRVGLQLSDFNEAVASDD